MAATIELSGEGEDIKWTPSFPSIAKRWQHHFGVVIKDKNRLRNSPQIIDGALINYKAGLVHNTKDGGPAIVSLDGTNIIVYCEKGWPATQYEKPSAWELTRDYREYWRDRKVVDQKEGKHGRTRHL